MMRTTSATNLLCLAMFTCVASACSFLPHELPKSPPPLFDLEEPLARIAEPQDEAARQALEPGSFSGIEIAQARATLDEMLEGSAGLEVAGVVENSPADVAGIEAGDLIVALERADPPGLSGGRKTLSWPSEWREIELSNAPGTRLSLTIDRAATPRTVELVLAPRARAAARVAAARVREEERVGVVLRTATEVEARAAGLAPGAGAVLVGLSKTSPWRRAGLQFGDLVTRVGGEPVADPQVLVNAIRAGEDALELDFVRAGAPRHVRAPLSSRESELTEFSIPWIYEYENDRGRTSTSALFGLYHFERTRVAWRMRLLWLISFSRGEADRLEEVDS